jgi:hypothetical protein
MPSVTDSLLSCQLSSMEQLAWAAGRLSSAVDVMASCMSSGAFWNAEDGDVLAFITGFLRLLVDGGRAVLVAELVAHRRQPHRTRAAQLGARLQVAAFSMVGALPVRNARDERLLPWMEAVVPPASLAPWLAAVAEARLLPGAEDHIPAAGLELWDNGFTTLAYFSLVKKIGLQALPAGDAPRPSLLLPVARALLYKVLPGMVDRLETRLRAAEPAQDSMRGV